MNSWSSSSIIQLASQCCVALCICVCTHAFGDDAPAKSAKMTVMVKQLSEPERLRTRSTITGLIKPARQSELSFERIGKLASLQVEEGDIIEAGQVLGRLNCDQLEAQLSKLQADHAAASAALKELRAGPRQETIDAARAEVAQQSAQLLLAEANYARRFRLYQQQLIAREEIETAATAVARLKGATAGAQKRLEDLQLGSRSERIEAQSAAVSAIEAAISAVHVELQHSLLRSPFAGTVQSRLVDEGVVVAPGRSILVVAESGALEAHFGLPLSLATSLCVGEPAQVLIRDAKTTGLVKAIVPNVDEQTRSLKCIIRIPSQSHESIVPGEIVKLIVNRDHDVFGYWLPSAALSKSARGLWTCCIAKPNGQQYVIESREVELLHTEGDQTLVRGGLRPRELVVTSAIHRITVGQAVEIHKSQPEASAPDEEHGATE